MERCRCASGGAVIVHVMERRPIPDGRGYEAGSDGLIYNPSGRALKGVDNKRGYLYVDLRMEGDQKFKHYKVHRLVALAWHGHPPDGKPEIRHLNGVRDDNRPANLAWGDRRDSWNDWRQHNGRPLRPTAPA